MKTKGGEKRTRATDIDKKRDAIEISGKIYRYIDREIKRKIDKQIDR
jgi:hypothetical protein